ncbi:hypothetical protein V8C40DRAFT_15083 [Trichoderma camerunense]
MPRVSTQRSTKFRQPGRTRNSDKTGPKKKPKKEIVLRGRNRTADFSMRCYPLQSNAMNQLDHSELLMLLRRRKQDEEAIARWESGEPAKKNSCKVLRRRRMVLQM